MRLIIKKMLTKILIFLVVIQTATQSSTLKVSIYYETFCIDSINFVRKQFADAYFLLADHLDVNWLPYGKASHYWDGDEYKINCRHGRDECSFAALHSCAVMMRGNQPDIVRFINCTMGIDSFSDDKEILACSEKCGYVHDELMKCATGRLGNILLAHFGDLTKAVKPRIAFVPTIIFNDKFDQDLQDRAFKNFLKTTCNLLDSVPTGCQTSERSHNGLPN